jgi:hypothetical protein
MIVVGSMRLRRRARSQNKERVRDACHHVRSEEKGNPKSENERQGRAGEGGVEHMYRVWVTMVNGSCPDLLPVIMGEGGGRGGVG